MYQISLILLAFYVSECPNVKNHMAPHTSLTFSLNFTMDKTNLPYGEIIRQEVQLIVDPKKNPRLPWVSFASLSGGRNGKQLFFVKWDRHDSYNDSKMITNLPINEEFKVLVRSYGDLGDETYITFDCPLKDLSTNLWYCQNKQTISSDKVCDTKEDCYDKSDEDATLCRGSNNKLIQISKCVNITLLVIGYIVSAAYFSFRTATARWSDVDNVIMEKDDANPLTDTDIETFNEVFEVCKKFQEWNNTRLVKCPKKEDFSKIVEKYKLLHEGSKTDKRCRQEMLMMKMCIKNLSLSDSFKYTCFEIMNCLINLEHNELHANEDPTAANRCIKKTLAGNWIVSEFVIQSKEKNDCMARLKRRIKERFNITCFNGTALTITVTLTILLYLIDTIIPYLDSHMDASLTITINHIEKFFITSVSKSKEISFIHLTVTKYYYFFVGMFSSLVLAVYYLANLSVFTSSPESLLCSSSHFGRTKLGRACSYLPAIFPYHFLASEYVCNNYRRNQKENEMKRLLETMILEDNPHVRNEQIGTFMKLGRDLKQNCDYAADLNRIITGFFIINLLTEGGPQLIVTTSLLVAELTSTTQFTTLRVMFENVLHTYIGMPGNASFIMMIVLQVFKLDFSLITIFSSQTYGLQIGLAGGLMKLLAVLCLVAAKIVLVTLQFYQMPYVYGLVTIGEFVVAFVYCKITQTKVSISADILPIVVTPALHVIANRMIRHTKGKHFRKNFAFLFMWDGTLNIVILHLAYLLVVYIPLQYISQMEIFLAPEKQNKDNTHITYAVLGYVLAIVPFLILRGAFHMYGRRWRLLENNRKQSDAAKNVDMTTESTYYERYVDAYNLDA